MNCSELIDSNNRSHQKKFNVMVCKECCDEKKYSGVQYILNINNEWFIPNTYHQILHSYIQSNFIDLLLII